MVAGMKTATCSLCGSEYEPASGKALRQERRRRGLSLQAMADAMGLSKQVVSQLELGRVAATPRAVERYERALAVAVPSKRKRRTKQAAKANWVNTPTTAGSPASDL